MRIKFVSDFFIEEGQGGAEFVDDYIIKKLCDQEYLQYSFR